MKILNPEFIKSALQPSDYPTPPLAQIAFAGRSNVGKSSVLNTLVNRKRLARISSTPGRTQTINFFMINGNFHFVDLPGYGYAKVPKTVQANWGRAIERYLKENPYLKLVVLILDIRRIPSEQDIQLDDWLTFYCVPVVYVLTKCDKVSKNKLEKHRRDICAAMSEGKNATDKPFVFFSAKSGIGKKELLKVIFDSL